MDIINSYEKESNSVLLKYKDIDKDVIEIFNKLISDKKISRDKLILYSKKLELLIYKATDLSIHADKVRKNNYNKMITISVLYLLFSLSQFILLILFPISTIITGTLIAYLGVKLLKNLTKSTSITNNLSKKITDNNNELKMLFENCYSFIEFYEKNNQVNLRSLTSLDDITLADIIIREYIENNNFITPDKKVSELIVKILQDELKTDESDINKLLENVKSEVNNIDEEIKKKRIFL